MTDATRKRNITPGKGDIDLCWNTKVPSEITDAQRFKRMGCLISEDPELVEGGFQ